MLKPLLLFFLSLTFLSGVGCVGPAPVYEYTIARSALKAARAAEANRYASGFLHESERLYRLAERQYKDREYEEARKNFDKARVYAERAENATKLKKFKSGEGI